MGKVSPSDILSVVSAIEILLTESRNKIISAKVLLNLWRLSNMSHKILVSDPISEEGLKVY